MRPSGAEAMWWVSLPSLLNEEWKLSAEAQFWVVSSSPTGAAGSLQSTSTPPHFNSSWCRWSGPWGQASPVISLACSAGTKRQVWKLACDSFFYDFERQLIVLVTVFTTDRWFSTKKKKNGQTALEKSLELGRMAESKCILSILCLTGSSEGFPSFLQFWMAFVFEKKKSKVCCCLSAVCWPLNLSVVYHGFSRGFCGSLLSIFRSKLSF